MSTALTSLLVLICFIAGGSHFCHWARKVGRGCREKYRKWKCCQCWKRLRQILCCKKGASGTGDPEIPLENIPMNFYRDLTFGDPDTTLPKTAEGPREATSIDDPLEVMRRNNQSVMTGQIPFSNVPLKDVHASSDIIGATSSGHKDKSLNGGKTPPQTYSDHHSAFGNGDKTPHQKSCGMTCPSNNEMHHDEMHHDEMHEDDEGVYAVLKSNPHIQNDGSQVVSPPIPPRAGLHMVCGVQKTLPLDLSNTESEPPAAHTRSHDCN
jgi:hypothetical protein